MNELTDAANAYPRFVHQVPFEVIQEGRYEARFARNESDLEALLRLRYEVFNLELDEGLEESHLTGLDRDRFDDVCHHLLVCHRETGEVVGTYRMQTNEMAEGSFWLLLLWRVRPDQRAAAGDRGRSGGRTSLRRQGPPKHLRALPAVAGLARYMANNNRRFLFGCCSLTSQDPHEGLAVMHRLEREGHLHPTLRILPQPGYECYDPTAPPELPEGVRDKIPQLFRIYLRHGAKVCGPPAIDREFKTIDYLVIFDIAAMDERQFRRFFG